VNREKIKRRREREHIGSTSGKPDRERYTKAADQKRLALGAMGRTMAGRKRNDRRQAE
jgi:hypothetical protein